MKHMIHDLTRRRIAARAAAVVLVALAAAAIAETHDRPRVAPPPLYQQECGACHLAYPPQLLPAPSWQRLMAGLPRHFGTDASLDGATTRTLVSWLTDNAGRSRRNAEAPPEDRITRAAWFAREHRELAASTWKLPAVGGGANCAACHPAAGQGEFDEHAVRIPR